MAKQLKFIFEFPPIHGVFNTGCGEVYIFGDMHEDQIESTLTHETLHYAIEKVAGKKASLRYDKVYSYVEEEYPLKEAILVSEKV